MFKIDSLEYVIEINRDEEDLSKSIDNQIQLEVPEYYEYYEYKDKKKEKENLEPKRVIIIEL